MGDGRPGKPPDPVEGPRAPISSIGLFLGSVFRIKIQGLDREQNVIYERVFDSDRYGGLNLKVPVDEGGGEVATLQVYEVGQRPGLDLHLGSFIPIRIRDPKKVLICDFDKTLVDTRYSTTREMYHSLTRPLEDFPTVANSVSLVKGLISEGYHPFILSASPHFYEGAIRDWLYRNGIFTAGIFLKDYRLIFNLLDKKLTRKDIRIHGIYKLNQILDTLIMTGPPDHLVLVGDNFESDPTIYLCLAKLLVDSPPPWEMWRLLDRIDAIRTNRKQKSQLLNKIYRISDQMDAWRRGGRDVDLRIRIRRAGGEDRPRVPEVLRGHLGLVELYDGGAVTRDSPRG